MKNKMILPKFNDKNEIEYYIDITPEYLLYYITNSKETDEDKLNMLKGYISKYSDLENEALKAENKMLSEQIRLILWDESKK